MPLRNKVPTLKLLAVRKIVEPNSLLMTTQNIAILEHQRRQYSYASTTQVQSLLNSNEQVMNGLIRVNHYCGTELSRGDINFLRACLCPNSITTLDFLHVGFKLHDETSVESFAGTLPHTAAPRPLSLITWLDLTRLLTKTGNDSLKNLYVYLDIEQNPLFRDQILRSFMGFSKLVRLVVHGNIGDIVLGAIGFGCRSLKMLDLRGSNVTDKGVIQLLVKNSKETLKQAITYQRFDIRNTIMNPVAHTLKYLDISTVPPSGLLFEDDRLILAACPNLCGTPNRLFFDPGGVSRVQCPIDRDTDWNLDILQTRLSSKSRYFVQRPNGIVDLWLRMRPYYTYAETITSLEVRVNINGEECGFLFYHRSLLTIEFQLENLTILQIHSYHKSRAVFLPLDIISEFAPNVKIIKASLEGTVTETVFLPNLEKLTIPMCHQLETLISLVKYTPSLVYLEVGEILLSKTEFNDSNIIEMITPTSCQNLQVLRFLFYNSISLANGLRIISLSCPKIRVIGDLKYFNIALPSISKFMSTMSSHNFDLMIEHDRLLYHTNTKWNEFYE